METVALIFGSGTLMDIIGIPIVSKKFHFFPISILRNFSMNDLAPTWLSA
jgi:hypothetical protein